MSIRFTLSRVMKERKLTNKDVMEITGLHRNTVKTLAYGLINRVDFNTLDVLCKELEILPADLIEYVPDETETATE